MTATLEVPPSMYVFFDGLMAPSNPGGFGCVAWRIVQGIERAGEIEEVSTLKEGAKTVFRPEDKKTNNEAEYAAVIEAIKQASELDLIGFTVVGDSQLVIRQLTGMYQVKSEKLLPWYVEANNWVTSTACKLQWVEREKNWRTDKLAEMEYERVLTEESTGRKTEGVKVMEYLCPYCNASYVMRVLSVTPHCMLCLVDGKPVNLVATNFQLKSMPQARMIKHMSDQGYRVCMYKGIPRARGSDLD